MNRVKSQELRAKNRTSCLIPRISQGFTLIEMLVSVAIFVSVMAIALGALLSMSESDRRAQTLKSVINNLNFSLDAISRTARTGTTYYCGALSASAPVNSTRDCASSPSTGFAFKDASGQATKYCLGNDSTCSTS